MAAVLLLLGPAEPSRRTDRGASWITVLGMTGCVLSVGELVARYGTDVTS